MHAESVSKVEHPQEQSEADLVLRKFCAMDEKNIYGMAALLGDSGCGKSAMLKLISGLTPATQGTIRVDGMAPKNARETNPLLRFHLPRQRCYG